MKQSGHKYILFIIATFLLLPLNGGFAEDLLVGGTLEPKQYGTYENIVTQNPCIINPGVNVIFATDMKTFVNKGFTLKIGGTLKITIYDEDGLPNEWENTYFGNCDSNPDDDPDGDGLTNIMEYQIGTNPTVSNISEGSTFADTDSDGLSDSWELINYGSLDQTADGDYDGDKLINIIEFNEETDILYIEGNLKDISELTYSGGNIVTKNITTVPSSNNHTICEKLYTMKVNPGFSVKTGSKFSIRLIDNDGLSNAWEMYYFGNTDQDPNGDYDGDGLSNIDEFNNNSAPNKIDTDGDGLNDLVEVTLGTATNDASSRPDPGNYYRYDAIGRVKMIIRIR